MSEAAQSSPPTAHHSLSALVTLSSLSTLGSEYLSLVNNIGARPRTHTDTTNMTRASKRLVIDTNQLSASFTMYELKEDVHGVRMLVVGGKVGWRLVGDTWRIGHWWAAQSSPAWGEREESWRLGRDEESGETPGETPGEPPGAGLD